MKKIVTQESKQQITMFDSLFEYLLKVYSVKGIDFTTAKLLINFKRLVKIVGKKLDNIEIEVNEKEEDE